MRRFRSNSAPLRDPQDALGLALRQEFARDVEAQRDKIPSANSIQLVARFEARVLRRTRADALLAWTHSLLLSTLAGLLAIWWERIATSPLDVTLSAEPWMQAIGLAAILFAMAFGRTRILLRTG